MLLTRTLVVTGNPPYRGGTQLEVMRAIVDGEPPSVRAARPDLPTGIDAIVSRALQKDPAKRYQGAAEMERDLSAALAALDSSSPVRSRLRTAFAIPVLALLMIAAGVAAWLYQRADKRHWAREQAIPEIKEALTAAS